MALELRLQSEASECGLACVAMVASALGHRVELGELRRRFNVSLKGTSLQSLISLASAMGMTARPLRAELEALPQLATPCILHWDLNHFVVLKKATARGAVILDPAVGERRLSLAEVSRHFTGVVLELAPNADFSPRTARPRLPLRRLTGRVPGLRGAIAQVLMVAMALETFAIAAPLFTQLVIDDAISSQDTDLLGVLAVGFGLLLLAQTMLGLARSWMVTVLGQTVHLQWAGNVFAHLLRLPVDFFEKRHLGDVESRFRAVGDIQRTLTTAAVEAFLDGMLAVAALVMMMLYAPTLAVVVLAAVAVYALLRLVAYGPFRSAAAERLVVAARENSHVLETLRAMAPIKLFGREEERRARWQNLMVEVQNREVRTARMNIGFASAKTLIFGVENLLVLWLGAKLAMAGAVGGAPFTVGMLLAFIAYKLQFTGRVSTLINHCVDLKMLGMHAERVADIALHKPERDDVPPHDLSHLAPSIELRDVSFRYGQGEPWVLRHANLVVGAGESVAVTGPSGAGKTTLLKIMLGLLEPSEGEVLYGGVAVRQLGIANFRAQVGTVMQEDMLLTGSLADNISFFAVNPDLARIEACARIACLHEDIVAMPMGYRTLVGDLGSGLSGGQKQRVLLARALYKQPRVLALDEATSHLDLGSERIVTQTLARMRLTRVIIAHRPETIAGARRVVQLRAAALVEVLRKVSSAPSAGGAAVTT